MKPRRIVLSLTQLFKTHGGIPRFNQMLCQAIDEAAARLDLRGTVISQDDSPEDYRAGGAAWRHLEFVPGGGQKRLALRTLAACARQRPQLLLMGTLGMTPAGLASRPWLRVGYGFVAHGAEVWEEPRRSRRFTAHHARFALAVSTHTKASVERLTGLPPSTVYLLHNTLDRSFERVSNAECDERSAGPELLVVCRLWACETMKGVDHTIAAFARLAPRYPTARLRVVGKGDDKPRLQALAASLGVERRTLFEEDLTDEALAERYRRCAAFVMPSGQEGFGIVFLEAMRFGKPCVGGDAGGTPDVIADGETGFLVPFGDEDALERVLQRLLSDADLRGRMGRAGLQRLERHFVFERFRARVEEILLDLLDEPA